MSSGFTYSQNGINGGLVIIDDLDYDATLCDKAGVVNPFITQVKPLAILKSMHLSHIGQEAVPAAPADDVQACQMVSCNFDSGKKKWVQFVENT